MCIFGTTPTHVCMHSDNITYLKKSFNSIIKVWLIQYVGPAACQNFPLSPLMCYKYVSKYTYMLSIRKYHRYIIYLNNRSFQVCFAAWKSHNLPIWSAVRLHFNMTKVVSPQTKPGKNKGISWSKMDPKNPIFK